MEESGGACRDLGGDLQQRNMEKAGLKETKAVWRAADSSCMLKHMEKCAAPMGFSQWSPRDWDLENRIS